MGLKEASMPASPSDATPSQFDATRFHPEFGYLVPTMRVRRKAALTIKAAALGVLVGAAAMFVLVMDREERALTMVSTPVLATPVLATPARSTPAQAAAVNNAAPVPFVPESIALPDASPAKPRILSVAPPTVAPTASDMMVTAAAPTEPAIAAAPAPAEVKAVAKPKKKVVREPEPDRTMRRAPPELNPRAAFAGPFRRFAEPPELRYERRPIYGYGW
jgi:hypothetical protein